MMKGEAASIDVQLQGLSPNQSGSVTLHQWLSFDVHTPDSNRPFIPLSSALTNIQHTALTSLMSNFSHLFRAPSGLPPPRSLDHTILLNSTQPICVCPYRYPHLHKTENERQVQELLALGMNRASTSTYSNLVLVRKKDKSWRICVDYRALNKATIPNKYPIFVVEELLHELHGAFFFSKVDLKSGYNQIRMHAVNIEKTAFRTHDGHYEYLVMPFGLTNAPATFQAIMNDIFRLWLRFKITSIDYLGHIIDGQGVSMDPNKIVVVLDWPVPKTLKGLREVLGLTGYYHKFINNYGSIALVTTPFLSLPDFTCPFIIECDAFGRGIGTVLMQNRKPIAYFSRSLSDRNLSKSAYECEMMALVLAVQHGCTYLLGTRLIVYTDQHSLKYLLQQRVSTPAQQNWVAKLLGYNFDFQYKPGRENRAADALSRKAYSGEFNSLLSAPVWLQGAQLIEEAKADVELQNLVQQVQLDPNKYPECTLKNGVLHYRNQVLISQHSKLLPALLPEFHTTATGVTLVHIGDWLLICIGQIFQKQSERILSMDFIVGLPTSKGFNVILVMVDRLSKYAHFILLKQPYTAKSVAEMFIKEVIRHHGIPKSIVSGRLTGIPYFLVKFGRRFSVPWGPNYT
ncbi:hypothetical protein E3N88_32280 [Mikania micrantha]|uniref:Reverse transcriptase domain-containing protein n=1 Tax=Mikania micrantha TaxID=192012 RepID=A0A5N6M9B0_9ASTR|nr:hypothetical protein E3N88_32280 [Mikania micrantha]